MINYIKGDLFAAKGILGHACNCHGVWGGGIALVFKKKYPHAYKVYHEYCMNKSPSQLLGTCLLIPERDSNVIACLFTSDNSSQQEIVRYTRDAVRDLVRQTSNPINIPQINAGIFAVPWELTEQGLKEFESSTINVYVL
ncbi:ADP-ribose 1''-phosphate phosphatase [Wickerhamiella sorbophila]|uniref:ADP-ribose 1''-phosphate phosphatase n=1 Tax=Wickerhamiella sorbophila TaxID=45607 RepID=A0A2T0FIM1_9ASCO|nr:ADP-ribose 1''-phosphate phosphatase [Wickerhamiella sorbophila]PRT54851.1 ADP-ribose 1''-phosphate phosphatase [Wickerhamiella sorbophila]